MTGPPYRRAARAYLASGVGQPLPVPPRAKHDPPRGFTGRSGARASAADVEEWCASRGDGNVALRLNPGVVGIDVDAHKGERELAAWRALVQQYGALPAAPRCTSRSDAESGIRLFRVPEDYEAVSDLGPAGEVIQFWHRYAVVPPSLSPASPKGTGRPYRWNAARIPQLADLPELPPAWVNGLRAGTVNGGHGAAWTNPDLFSLLTRGIPAGATQDDYLRDLVFGLVVQGVAGPVIRTLWEVVVARTPLTRPAEPWTDADFSRHYRGAIRKAGAA